MVSATENWQRVGQPDPRSKPAAPSGRDRTCRPARARNRLSARLPHAIDISPDGSRLAGTSYGADEVFIVSTATDKVVATIPVGREPLDIEYSPDGRYLYNTNSQDNTVSVIDTATDTVIDTIKTGQQPTSIDILPSGRQAYITDEGSGSVEVLNLPR